MKIKAFAAAAAMGLFCLASSAQAGDQSLDASAIHGLFPGYYHAEVMGGYELLIAAKSNGRLQGKAFGAEDKGRWTVVGNRLCVSWSHWTDGKSKCGNIVRTGRWYVARDDKNEQLLRFTAMRADAFYEHVASNVPVGRK
jgi:hypothetical protein